MKILHLPIKKEFFEQIAAGIKLEEYRQIKPYWISRLLKYPYSYSQQYFHEDMAKQYDVIYFRNGYAATDPLLVVEYKGLKIGPANSAWAAGINWPGDVFILQLGQIITT
jgi:hypothetical protein